MLKHIIHISILVLLASLSVGEAKSDSTNESSMSESVDQDNLESADLEKDKSDKKEERDPFNFSEKKTTVKPNLEPLLKVDHSIKIRVEPVVPGHVIDRVMGPATIFVNAANFSSAEIYIEPVDAPYGGKSLGEPKLIGKSSDARHEFPVAWVEPSPYPYVRLFAIVQSSKKSIKNRSAAIDIALGGMRLKPILP